MAIVSMVLFVVSSCGLTKNPCPSSAYNQSKMMSSDASIRLPLSVKMDDLQGYIRSKIPLILYKDDDAGGQGIDVEVLRAGDPELLVDGKILFLTLPVDIKATRDMGFLKARAAGSAFFRLKSEFDILPDWTLTTRTSLEGIDWEKDKKSPYLTSWVLKYL